ncbi:hypothetical protein C8039_03335 [Halogeometricum sp. wsp3]|nr:hypothetical protein C8039_03335 [Halogeometricum sp. wsp3]
MLSDGATADQGEQSGGEISDEPIQAGLLTFTRGAPGVLGIQAQRGAELAVQRINEAGGIGGHRESNWTSHERSKPLETDNQFIVVSERFCRVSVHTQPDRTETRRRNHQRQH